MIALDRGRKAASFLLAAATAGALAASPASAQLFKGRNANNPAPAAAPAPAPAPTPGETPQLKLVKVPVNTTDPIAIVNGEIITRQQLADECVARKGQEILETLIARRLIEQAMRSKKMEVTAADIDAEIDRVAMQTAGVTREVWLRTLDKEKGISPAQYARDIIYPALALRKLAAPRVQVTEQDIKDAFEANYGPRMRCRIIMTDNISKAKEIWEQLRKNPAGFEKIAKERSLDSSTRSLGGLLPEPIARHAYPRTVSDSAFAQLVDGDPQDKDPRHKPKDGDITGPIQVNEGAWVILKREALSEASAQNPTDPTVRKMLNDQMFDVKLTEAMKTIYEDLMRGSSIDNKLTGQVKMANEEDHPDFRQNIDGNVKLMSSAGETKPSAATAGRVTGPTSRAAAAGQTPAGVPADAVNTARSVQQTIQAPPGSSPRN
jgi:foldase protein PrsA